MRLLLLVALLGGCGNKSECEAHAEEYCERLIACVLEQSRAECVDARSKFLSYHRYSEDECISFRKKISPGMTCEQFRAAAGFTPIVR